MSQDIFPNFSIYARFSQTFGWKKVIAFPASNAQVMKHLRKYKVKDKVTLLVFLS